MTVRQKQILWIDKMKADHPSVTKMMKTLASNEGRASYAYKLQKFMVFAAEKKYVKHSEDFESLLGYEPEQLTDILEDFVNYLENRGLVSSSVRVTLIAIELFFEKDENQKCNIFLLSNIFFNFSNWQVTVYRRSSSVGDSTSVKISDIPNTILK